MSDDPKLSRWTSFYGGERGPLNVRPPAAAPGASFDLRAAPAAGRAPSSSSTSRTAGLASQMMPRWCTASNMATPSASATMASPSRVNESCPGARTAAVRSPDSGRQSWPPRATRRTKAPSVTRPVPAGDWPRATVCWSGGRRRRGKARPWRYDAAAGDASPHDGAPPLKKVSSGEPRGRAGHSLGT